MARGSSRSPSPTPTRPRRQRAHQLNKLVVVLLSGRSLRSDGSGTPGPPVRSILLTRSGASSRETATSANELSRRHAASLHHPTGAFHRGCFSCEGIQKVSKQGVAWAFLFTKATTDHHSHKQAARHEVCQPQPGCRLLVEETAQAARTAPVSRDVVHLVRSQQRQVPRHPSDLPVVVRHRPARRSRPQSQQKTLFQRRARRQRPLTLRAVEREVGS